MNKNKLINQSIQKQKLKQLHKSRHIKQMDKQKLKQKQKLRQKQKQKLRQKQKQKQKLKLNQKQKINRNRMNQNNIMKSRINMVDQQEQIIINKQEIPKKTLSKRFNLDSIKKQQKDHIIKDNNHQNEYKKQIQNNILDKRPQTTQLKRIPPFSYYKVRMTSPQIDIKFIQDTQQLQNFMNQQNSPNIQKNESLRRNIFPHSSTQLKPIQSAKQEEIIIKKYGGRRQQINKQYSITPYQYTYQTPISKNTQRKQLKTQKYLNSHSPSTAFNYRGQGSNYKKLSEFNRQKKQRRRQIENQPLSKIQDYIILPYLQNFNNLNNFNHYRSNCLQDNSLLYGSPLLFITFSATRISYAKLKVQILYQNKCDVDLSIQTLYRVPKSMKVNKQSTIKKKWVLSDSNSHSFCLQIVSFPIQPCLINLKYAYECNHDDFKKYQPTIISLPITIRNFCQYLIINEYQWVQKWIEWTENMNYKGVKNIILQNQVVNENNLELILKQFIKFNPVEGYSIKQFGLYSRQLEMTFLLRISQRIGQILTIEVLSDRKNITQDQIDYLEYCLNTWSMLLAKIQFQNQAD